MDKSDVVKGMTWVARAISVVAVVMFVSVFIFGPGVTSMDASSFANALYHTYGTLVAAIVFTGQALSYWRLLPAAAVCIFAFLFGAISSIFVDRWITFWPYLSISSLISGGLFLASWILLRKNKHTSRAYSPTLEK